MANRYFVNGGVDNNWSTSGNWSTISGGSGGAGVPVAADDVFFDTSSPIVCLVGTAGGTCHTLNCDGYGGTITITATKTLYCRHFSSTGTPSIYLTIQSSIASSKAYLLVGDTVSYVSYVVAIDIDSISGVKYPIYNPTGTITRCKNWIGYRYFVNGGVDNNWGTAGNWSRSSGGTGGAGVPDIYDIAFLDENSPNCTINAGGTRNCWDLNCTDYTGTLTAEVNLTIYENLTFVPGMTFVPGTYTITFALASNGLGYITTAGKVFYGLKSNYSWGELHLEDDLTVRDLYISEGFYAHTHQINVSNSLTVNNELDMGTSTVIFTSSSITVTGGSSGWLANVSIPAGCTLNLNDGMKWTGTMNAYGTVGSHVIIRSSTPGTKMPFSMSGYLGTFDYVDLIDLTIYNDNVRMGKIIYNLAVWGGSVTNCERIYDTAPSTVHITNYSELQAIASDPRMDANYILDNDIDCSDEADFAPIGFYNAGKQNYFSGTFDGQNHTIFNLKTNEYGSGGDPCGLFGYVGSYAGSWHGGQRAEIRNLILENPNIRTAYAGGALCGFVECALIDNVHVVNGTIYGYPGEDAMSLGGLCGEIYGWLEDGTQSLVTNCTSSGTVNGADFIGGLIGGIWGFNDTTIISDCSSSVTVTSESPPYDYDNDTVGGFIGFNQVLIKDCYCTGDVIINSSPGYDVDGVGGFAGQGSNFDNCYSTGDVIVNTPTADSAGSIGGFTGQTWGEYVTGCYCTGDVTVVNDDVFGVSAFIGDNQSELITGYCYAIGNVNVSGLYSISVGGFNGELYGTIEKCYYTGMVSVTSTTSEYVGGFVGNIYGATYDPALGLIRNCYALADVQGYDYTGGFCGYQRLSTCDINNSYSIGNVTGHDYVGGFIGGSFGMNTNVYSVGLVVGNSSVGGFMGKNFGTDNILNCSWCTTNNSHAVGDDGMGYPMASLGWIQDIDQYTKLLAHFDGTDGSTDDYIAETGQTMTTVNQAQLDTAFKRFGSASMLLDGTGDYCTVPASTNWNFATDFTIECWIRAWANNDNQTIIKSVSNEDWDSATTGDWALCLGSTAKVAFYIKNIGLLGGQLTLVASQTWTHIAVVRYNGVVKVYVNGIPDTFTLTDSSVYGNTQVLTIGSLETHLTVKNFDGHIDEVRISNGIARWTADFSNNLPRAYGSGYGTDEPDNTQFYHKEHQVYQNSE